MSKYLIFLLFCSSLFQISYAQDCTPKPRGWYVRVCANKEESSGFRLWIGVPDKFSHRLWREWHKGDELEFSMPIEFCLAKEIWLEVTDLEDGKNVYICVRFNDHTVKHYDMDGDPEPQTFSRDDNDEC